MNENNLGRRAKASLDGALEQLDRHCLERLAQARHAALAVYASPLRRRAGVLVGGAGRVGDDRSHARQWVSLMALLLGLLGAYFWLDHDAADDEVDAILLADDLPLQAYVDHQFDKWLER
jgi:hypothetical protein